MDSVNFFSAKSLLPSAFNASAMLERVRLSLGVFGSTGAAFGRVQAAEVIAEILWLRS
jgi:DNA/RNA-binding domain of Phe-tRNA-synthetase-like protein